MRTHIHSQASQQLEERPIKMLTKIKNSPIPLWVNLLLVILIVLMTVQVFWNYFDNATLLDFGITIEGDPDQNVTRPQRGWSP